MNTQPKHTFCLTDNELATLDQFIKNSATYIEELEAKEHTELREFWQKRMKAMRVVSELLVQRIEQQNHTPKLRDVHN
jgi:hypothetical protein